MVIEVGYVSNYLFFKISNLMAFRPLFTRDRVWAGLGAGILLLLALLMLFWARNRPLGPGTTILGGLALLMLGMSALLIYRLWALHTLDYWVQRDAIHIHWLGEEAVIPLPHVQEIIPATLALAPDWWRWPQQWLQSDAEKRVFSYATQPPEQSLAIVTADEVYLVSPQRPQDFVQAYEQRQQFGPARLLKRVIYLAPWRQHWLLTDRLAQGALLGGLVLGWLVLGYVIWRYPQLPATIALHMNNQGMPDLLSPRHAIFLLPGIALLIGFLNAAIGFAFYGYQRFLSYLLWSLSFLLQIITFLAVANLINLAVRG